MKMQKFVIFTKKDKYIINENIIKLVIIVIIQVNTEALLVMQFKV